MDTALLHGLLSWHILYMHDILLLTTIYTSFFFFYVHISQHVDMSLVEPKYHLFRLETCDSSIEELDEGEMDIPAATHWVLPSAEFDDLWDNLIYDTPIKEQVSG